jgi:hypothetical protein
MGFQYLKVYPGKLRPDSGIPHQLNMGVGKNREYPKKKNKDKSHEI